MSIEINIPQSMYHLAKGEKRVAVEGSTVGDCLNVLVGRYPDMKPLLFTKKGKLHSYIEIFINKETSYPEELAKAVADGDKLDIINIIAGG